MVIYYGTPSHDGYFSHNAVVEFNSLTSNHVFRGRIVRRLCATHYLVDDHSTRAPRPIPVHRLRYAQSQEWFRDDSPQVA